ncbi:hypothetical protein VPH35_008279 [Triticum aestivum]
MAINRRPRKKRNTRAAHRQQLDWLDLPSELLELIAQRSRDPITGLTAFRSVCRTWRAAAEQAPRLLLPVPRNGSAHALVFPLPGGWSVVVDARDASCRLSHLTTGATAALPKISVVHDGKTMSDIRYAHHTDAESARKVKIRTPFYDVSFRTYLEFSDHFRFAIHAPPGSLSASTDGMMIIMYHRWLLERESIVVCRPGDAAWTKLPKRPSSRFDYFIDVTSFQGKIYGLESNGATMVFDATTLEFLCSIDAPQSTSKLYSMIYWPYKHDDPVDFDYFHLVALPNKLLLVVVSVKSLEPTGFAFFELTSGSRDGRLSWSKVTGDGIGGNYDVFMDCHHATFSDNNGVGTGTRVYYVLHRTWHPKASTYYYGMHDGKMECLYRSLDDNCEYSTKPSWFVP